MFIPNLNWISIGKNLKWISEFINPIHIEAPALKIYFNPPKEKLTACKLCKM